MAAWTGAATVEPLGLGHSHSTHAVLDAPHENLSPAFATTTLDTDPFGLVAVTADSPLDLRTRVLVRVREDGMWSSWEQLDASEDRPDPNSLEAANARYGTEPLITGTADGVQMRMDTPNGVKPANARLVLLDNPVTNEDANLRGASEPIATAEA
ncbi:MAG: hypothetical protein F2923_09070, partial [Actinobacteria bacterium]|nr:hypothetical protein [Actinomycetota bacterium]